MLVCHISSSHLKFWTFSWRQSLYSRFMCCLGNSSLTALALPWNPRRRAIWEGQCWDGSMDIRSCPFSIEDNLLLYFQCQYVHPTKLEIPTSDMLAWKCCLRKKEDTFSCLLRKFRSCTESVLQILKTPDDKYMESFGFLLRTVKNESTDCLSSPWILL